MPAKRTSKYTAKLMAIAAMYAALLVAGKQALALLPNVEVVTLLVAVAAYAWGPAVVYPAVNVFIAVDAAIWGPNTWVISYVIHWNLLATCFWLLGKLHHRRASTEVALAATVAVTFTLLFGVLTTLVDVLVGYTGKGFFVDVRNVAQRFAVMYTAGVWFFVTQTVCNAVLFATAFRPLVKLNRRFDR